MTLANSFLQSAAPFPAPFAIELLFDQTHKLLFVPFPEKLTRLCFDRVEAALAKFTARRGPVDAIIDFHGVSEDIDTKVIVARAYRPWPAASGRRQVFIVSNDLIEGIFRMYAVHHRAAGFDAPLIARSLDGALATLEVAAAEFTPVVHN